MKPSDASPWRPTHVLWALAALATVLFVVARRVPAFHAQPRFVPDSITYLEANAARTPVYPLVLRAIGWLPGGLDLLAPFQQTMFTATTIALAFEFFRTYQRPLLALVLEAAVLGHPQLVSYCFTVLPEALFVSVLMVHLSFVLILARRWSTRAAVVAGVSAATLALVKPSGYAAVAGLAILAFVHRSEWRRLHLLVAPAVLVILSACAGNLVFRGFFGTQTQGGYVRATYVATLLETTTPGRYPMLTDRVASQARPVGRALRSLPTLETYYLIAADEYHTIEEMVHQEIVAEISRQRGEAVTDLALFPNDAVVAERIDQIGTALANSAMEQHPGEYAYQVAANVYGLWWLPLVKTRSGAVSTQSEIDQLIGLRPALSRLPPAFHPLPRPAYFAVRVLLILILGSSVAGIFWIASRSPLRSTVAYVALLLHGYFLLVSLAQPGLPRYALAVWPASVLVLLATVGAAVYLPVQPRAQ